MVSDTLRKARKSKNDEFYTIEKYIEQEIAYYKDKIENKIIYCNCDNYEYSNFWKYFHKHFEELKLKKLIASFYEPNGKAIAKEYTGGDDTNISFGRDIQLKGNGDFRSPECVDLLKNCDVIITNPPFSLFREYINLVDKLDKKFLIIGNVNAVVCKDIFPLIKNNRMWVGATHFNDGMYFYVPDDFEYSKSYKFERFMDGKKVSRVSSICWFTNLDHIKRHKDLNLEKNYSSNLYKKYDNYNAIDIDNIKNIPKDYYDVMGIPITFINKWNPTQFEIIGCSQRGCHEEFLETRKYNDFWEVRQDGTKTGCSGNKANGNPNVAQNDGKHNIFINDKGDCIQSYYCRIFIRRLKSGEYEFS